MSSTTANPTHGTKVTTDPKGFENPSVEGAGVVTSDSLAAESTRRGEKFAENKNSEPSDVTSKSTSNNKNNSGTTKLSPAPDSETRHEREESRIQPRGPAGPKYDEGVGGQEGESSGKHHVDVAPSYVQYDVLDPRKSGKPKGTNITEGGFDSDDSKNASFTAEIGSENDPGRLATAKFQREAAESGPDAGRGPRQKNTTGQGEYDGLPTEEAL
ncbi:MAG: hypothetical protein M1832_003920 [Thelocarpon impressellum]|nr:MAG: hypothetical protein M1832_003920 [Thelocarpon impressellum]